MAKVITRQFEELRGVNHAPTPLSREEGLWADSLLNLRFGSQTTLEPISGVQAIAQATAGMGLHSYSYIDQITGETREELLCLVRSLFQLKEYTFQITRLSGSDIWSWTCDLDVGTSRWYWAIQQDGVELWRRDLGTGLEESPFTVRDLFDAINAAPPLVGKFSATSFTGLWGRIAATGTFSTLPMLTSNYGIGDLVTVWMNGVSSGLYLERALVLTPGLLLGLSRAITVSAGQYTGVAAVPAATIPLNFSGRNEVRYSAWEAVRTNYKGADQPDPFSPMHSDQNLNRLTARLPQILNERQKAYFFGTSVGTPSAVYHDTPHTFDGRFFYRAGLRAHENPAQFSFDYSGPNVLPVGRYGVKIHYRFYDQQGNFVDGPLTDLIYVNSGAAFRHLLIRLANIPPSEGYNVLGARVVGAQNTGPGAINPITVQAPHQFRVGDRVFINHPDVQASYILATPLTTYRPVYTALVSAVTPTTISLDIPFLPLADLQWISSGMILRVYQTKPDGVDMYAVAESVNDPDFYLVTDGSGPGIHIHAQVPETNLGPKLIEPTHVQAPMPKAGVACTHQGALVLSAIKGEPNSVYVSVAGAPETTPTLNQLIIPSGILGPVTAVASDSDNRLAVFKERGHYSITGDLPRLAVSVASPNEGDYGISTHAALTKGKDALVGICPLGPIRIKDGIISTEFSRFVSPKWKGRTDLQPDRSRVFNDSTSESVIFYTPPAISVATSYRDYNIEAITADSGAFYAFDYDSNAWFDRFYPSGYSVSGGMANYHGMMHHLSTGGARVNGVARSGQLYRAIQTTPTLSATMTSVIHNQPITMKFAPQAERGQSPSFDKWFHRVKIWHFPTFTDSTLPEFLADFITYRNFNRQRAHTYITDRKFGGNDLFESVVTHWHGAVMGVAVSEPRFETVIDVDDNSQSRALQIVLYVRRHRQLLRVTGYEMEYTDINVNDTLRVP
jgi:hypothetical protein